MSARFFVDENDLALGRALAAERAGVLYPGHPGLPEIPRGSLDDVWLPTVGAKGLVVITRDKRIRYRPAEKLAWIDHAVRGFVLTGTKSQSTTDSKAILDRHWLKIEGIIDAYPDGPWMCSVTQSDVKPLDLG